MNRNRQFLVILVLIITVLLIVGCIDEHKQDIQGEELIDTVILIEDESYQIPQTHSCFILKDAVPGYRGMPSAVIEIKLTGGYDRVWLNRIEGTNTVQVDDIKIRFVNAGDRSAEFKIYKIFYTT